MRITVLIIALSLAACSPDEAEPNAPPKVEVDVPALIGGSPDQIEDTLGAFTCSDESGGQSCEFETPYTNVFFVNGKAANISLPWVYDMRSYGLELGEAKVDQAGHESWYTTINGMGFMVYRFPNYVYVMQLPT